MKRTLFYFLTLMTLMSLHGNAQDKKTPSSADAKYSNSVVMTWNKNTPETEMNDDIKALNEYGVTIKYSNIKRNSKEEITAIKVEFSDTEGNKGALEFDNQKPINTIKFFKKDDEVGFGEPEGIASFGGNSFGKQDSMRKGYSFNFNDDSFPPDSFLNDSGNPFTKSRIIIQKDGKKPLVMENGEVIEGGEDYTAEELEEIKKNTKTEQGGEVYDFNFNSNGNDYGNLAEQMKKMQEQLNKLMPPGEPGATPAPSTKSELDNTREEMLKAKEEMKKAKEEMEKAKKELNKAKSAIKTQKA